MTGKTNGMPDSRSYRDAVVAHMPPPQIAPPTNQHQANLKAHLRNMLRRHPEGMLLAQLRRASPLLFQPQVLGLYASTTELLCSMSDVLYMQGVGVQTRVYPADV